VPVTPVAEVVDLEERRRAAGGSGA
jgi:hypothetical protein